MQTLSPTISPIISKANNQKVTDAETDSLAAIAESSVLQTALTGLDANLNDELDRYRHWQENGQTISYLNPFRPRAVSTQSIWTSPSLSEALSPLSPPTEVNSDRRTIQMPVMPPLGTNVSPSINLSSAELHQYRGLDLENLESSNQIDLHEAFAYAQNSNAYDEIGNNSLTMAEVPEPDDDEILQNFANNYTDKYQDSINQESYPTPTVPTSAIRSLMNPVGIISLLLLLCSSAAIGYLMVDPSGVLKLFKPESKPKAAQNNGVNGDLGKDINLQDQKKANDSLSFLSSDRNQLKPIDGLTRNDKSITPPTFVNKNQLNNPSTKSSSLFAPSTAFLPSAPLQVVPSAPLPSLSIAPLPPTLAPLERSYSPAPAPKSEPVRVYSDPSSSERNSSSKIETPSKPVKSSSLPADTVAPKPAENIAPIRNTAVKYAAPLPSASSVPAASSYRVVVENSYAASAQQVERDAYVRPSDGQVQVGSYRDQNAAQQRIEQLRRQGIPARME